MDEKIRNRKKVLGITGGVGAGKSTVLSYLEQHYHARVIQLDQAAHLLMEPGTDCHARILEAFGPEILDAQGRILRPLLAERVFHDRAALEQLNGIVHPAVKAYVREQICIELSGEVLEKPESVGCQDTKDSVLSDGSGKKPEGVGGQKRNAASLSAASGVPSGNDDHCMAQMVVLEAALLLEEHYDEICDEIWYVFVPDEIRRKRLALSRGYTEEKTNAVLRNQKSDTEFRRDCQLVIDNSSEILETTYRQIDKGLKEHGFL